MNNGGTEALLAAPFAFPAKPVVFLPTTLIKKERPFFLEVFRHTGHRCHLLFTAELPICSRNAKMPETVSHCMFSGRFRALSSDMSSFQNDGGILTVRHSQVAVCRFRVTKKRRITTTLLSCSEKNIMLRSKIIFYLSTTGNCLHQFPKNMFLRHPLILHNQ